MGWSWGEVFLEEIELHFNLECFLEKCGTIRQRCEKKKKGRDVSPESCPRWRFPGMYEVREQLVEKEIFQGAEENGHAAPSL